MSDKLRKTKLKRKIFKLKRRNNSVNPCESIRLSSKSDDPCVSIHLSQHISDRRESIHLNLNSDDPHDLNQLKLNSDDPRESNQQLNLSSDDLRESIQQLNLNSDDPRESNQQMNLNSDDPRESNQQMNLNSDDPRESNQQLNLNSDDPRVSIQQLNLNCADIIESNQFNLKSEDPRESMRLDQYYNDLGYSRKTQNRSNITFTTSAVGLIELGNVVYRKLCEISPRFAENVSSSMFMYYVSQLHYMRLCCLEWEVSKPDADDLRVMNNMILRNRWTVPQLLADYFNSIGSFRDSAGIPAQHREIVFPCADEINGINGFFGRVDSTTHAHYENRISPGVAARRIAEDLIFTLHPDWRREGYWNLPPILRPAEKNACGPTGNLLGWSRATALTPKQVTVLKDCGVFLGEQKITFSHCTRFCHNNQLMSHISAHLNDLKERVKCVERLSTIPTGSIAQHDYQEAHLALGMLSRERVYGDISTYNCGFAPLHMHQELLAHVFRLRIVRRTIGSNKYTLNHWSCYDFNSYKEVPESWCKTRNLYFTVGKQKVWDQAVYKTKPADLRPLLNALMVKTLIQ